MRIAVSVVFYNPSPENIDNALKLADIFDTVYLLDNSNKALENLSLPKNVIYISYCENKGIAFALEDALERAIKDGHDFLLTLDQDSKYSSEQHPVILKRLEKLDLEKDGIFALTTDHELEVNPDQKDEEFVHDAITSGNFLNLSLMKKYDIHFPVELFIDYVDFEFDRRVLEKGLNIIQSHEFYILHTIGEPLRKNILGVKFTCMNHSPIRYYYRFFSSSALHCSYTSFNRSFLPVSSRSEMQARKAMNSSKRGMSMP